MLLTGVEEPDSRQGAKVVVAASIESQSSAIRLPDLEAATHPHITNAHKIMVRTIICVMRAGGPATWQRIARTARFSVHKVHASL